MNEPSAGKFHWKWVWLSLLMYIVFYSLPIALTPGGVLNDSSITKTSSYFMTIWGIGGMILISAVAGFISKGGIIKEQTVAAIGLMILWFIVIPPRFDSPFRFSTAIVLVMLIGIAIPLLALGGAWLGELIQRAGRKQKGQDSFATETNNKSAAP